MAPAKPPSMRLRRMEPPHLRGSAEAPTIATARGANSGVKSGGEVTRGRGADADAPRSPAGSRITSASAATGVASSTMRGFTSISVTAGWSSAMRARPDPRKHALDVPVVQRRHPERDVLVSLGEDPSDAEDDDRTEERIALHAAHELARSPDHPLYEQHSVRAAAR